MSIIDTIEEEYEDKIEELNKRIKELEEIYFGQIRVIARSRITHKEKVKRMVALAEKALKGGE